MEIGTYVEILGMDLRGRIINIRTDDRDVAIYTIELDNCTDTPSGLFIARRWEFQNI